MVTFALNHLSVFPTWIQQTTLVLCALVVITSLTARLAKIMQTSVMKTFFMGLRTLFVRLGVYLTEQMKDPISYPRAERTAQYCGIAIAYLMSSMLAVIAVSFTILWAIMHSHIPLSKTLVLFAFIFACWYMAAVLKAQAGRDRMNL